MVSSKANACTSEIVAPCEEATLPTTLSKYKPNQIYNVDAFL